MIVFVSLEFLQCSKFCRVVIFISLELFKTIDVSRETYYFKYSIVLLCGVWYNRGFMYQILLIMQNISYSYNTINIIYRYIFTLLIYRILDFILKTLSFLIFFKLQNIYFFSIQKITRIILHQEAPLFFSNLLNFAQPFRYSSSPHTPQIPTRIPQIYSHSPPSHPILTVLHCVFTPNLAVLAALKGYPPSPSYIK